MPDRVNVIRVMLSECSVSTATCCTSRPLFRTSAHDARVLRLYRSSENLRSGGSVTGFRMHPAWFRIGGVAHDLRAAGIACCVSSSTGCRNVWRLRESGAAKYHSERSFPGRCPYGAKEALEWGTTGAGLRATGSTSTCVRRVLILAMKTSTLNPGWWWCF